MSNITTLYILNDLVRRGDLRSFKLKTIEEKPGTDMREHDRLILIFPSGREVKIDTFCSGVSENVSIIIENNDP